MIEVNLLPGRRGGAKRRFSLSFPRRQKSGGGGLRGIKVDAWVLVPTAAVLLALGTILFLYPGTAGRADELQLDITAAARDSMRYAELIGQATALEARRDTVAERVALLQDIDGARYVWPHILDEVARAIPDYTWLTELTQITPGPSPRFRIEGRSGNTFALTRFLSALGDSPFLAEVALVSANQVSELGAGGRQEEVQQFVIEAGYMTPPPELLTLVPLFEDGGSDLAGFPGGG